MPLHLFQHCYPEAAYGGFSDIDGTIRFYTRVNAIVKDTDTVLDFGCGRASHADDVVSYRKHLRDLRGRVHKVIGLDVDPAASVNPFVDEFSLLGEGGKWPVSANSINCVITDFVLEHLAKPELFFREANRSLNKGGFLCARTPNKWGYVALAARVIPENAHGTVLSKAQPDRKEKDVFPTFYRCNTVTTLRKYLQEFGFHGVVYGYEAEPSYLNFSSVTYRLGTIVHRILPNRLRSSLFVFAQKL